MLFGRVVERHHLEDTGGPAQANPGLRGVDLGPPGVSQLVGIDTVTLTTMPLPGFHQGGVALDDVQLRLSLIGEGKVLLHHLLGGKTGQFGQLLEENPARLLLATLAVVAPGEVSGAPDDRGASDLDASTQFTLRDLLR